MELLDDNFAQPAPYSSSKAPLSVRIAHFITDGLATAVLTYGALLIVVQVAPEQNVFEQGSLTLPLLYALTSSVYFFIGEYWSGRTFGKMLTHSNVTTPDGSAPSAKQIAIRTLIRLIPLYPLIFVLGLQWHDRWAGVQVNCTTDEA